MHECGLHFRVIGGISMCTNTGGTAAMVIGESAVSSTASTSNEAVMYTTAELVAFSISQLKNKYKAANNATQKEIKKELAARGYVLKNGKWKKLY